MSLRVQDIERLHVQLLAAAMAIAVLTQWVSMWSLLLGGAVMGVNFHIMRRLFERLLDPQRRPRPALVMGLLLVKFTLFLGLLAVLLWRLPIDGMGFGIGATVLLVACVVAAVRQQVQFA
jgi:hypothetical protein